MGNPKARRISEELRGPKASLAPTPFLMTITDERQEITVLSRASSPSSMLPEMRYRSLGRLDTPARLRGRLLRDADDARGSSRREAIGHSRCESGRTAVPARSSNEALARPALARTPGRVAVVNTRPYTPWANVGVIVWRRRLMPWIWWIRALPRSGPRTIEYTAIRSSMFR